MSERGGDTSPAWRPGGSGTNTSTGSERSACSSWCSGTGRSRSCSGSPDGPSPTSPLGFTSGLWILTWLLQVLPLFFYVGGHVHLLSWDRARERGMGIGTFVWRRIRSLAIPALALAVTWIVLGAIVTWAFGIGWMDRVVLLIISPLWFIAVYLVLIALLPVALWLHHRFDVLVLIWLAGAALVVDVLRLRYGYEAVGWLNMIIVWGWPTRRGSSTTGW